MNEILTISTLPSTSSERQSRSRLRRAPDQVQWSRSARRPIEQNSDRSYVVVPAVDTFKQRGTAMRESAQMTVLLKKGAAGWLIEGWTWTGPKPRPDAGSAKE